MNVHYKPQMAAQQQSLVLQIHNVVVAMNQAPKNQASGSKFEGVGGVQVHQQLGQNGFGVAKIVEVAADCHLCCHQGSIASLGDVDLDIRVRAVPIVKDECLHAKQLEDQAPMTAAL